MKLWIAREKDNVLYLNESKPTLQEVFDNTWWWMSDKGMMRIDSNHFPEVTFENSPQEVELKLIK